MHQMAKHTKKHKCSKHWFLSSKSGESLLDMEEWLLISGTPASSVGAEDDSLGISKVESTLVDTSAKRNIAWNSETFGGLLKSENNYS